MTRTDIREALTPLLGPWAGLCRSLRDAADATDDLFRLDEYGRPLPGHSGYEEYMEDLYAQQQSEIDAEYAWLRAAENAGWDDDPRGW